MIVTRIVNRLKKCISQVTLQLGDIEDGEPDSFAFISAMGRILPSIPMTLPTTHYDKCHPSARKNMTVISSKPFGSVLNLDHGK